VSDLHSKVRDLYEAELKRAKAEMNAARDEVERLWQQREKTHGPAEKKKSGRPSIWRGYIGFVLVGAVEEIIIRKLRRAYYGDEEEVDEEERSVDLHDPEDYGLLEMANEKHAHSPKGGRRLYNLAQAVRKAVKTDPRLQEHKEVFSRLSDRALQARYQQAAEFWSNSRGEASDREREAARSRLREAIEEVNRLCDALED
jgi:hypothetical protein